MNQYLPHSKIKSLNQKEIDKFNVNLIDDNSLIGYILEVDFEDPDELHNNYPLAPEKLEIIHNMLSKYCSGVANKCDIKIGSNNKLVPNLSNKSK